MERSEKNLGTAGPFHSSNSSLFPVPDSKTPTGAKASITDISESRAFHASLHNHRRHSNHSGVFPVMSHSSLDGQTADSSRSSEDHCKDLGEQHHRGPIATSLSAEEEHEWQNAHNGTSPQVNNTNSSDGKVEGVDNTHTRIIRSYYAVEEGNGIEEEKKEALIAQQQFHFETMEDHDYCMLKETIQETVNPLLRSAEELQSVYPTYHAVERGGGRAPEHLNVSVPHNRVTEAEQGGGGTGTATVRASDDENEFSWRYGYDDDNNAGGGINNGVKSSLNIQRLLAPKGTETSDDVAERRRPARERFPVSFAVSHAGPSDVVSNSLPPLDMMPPFCSSSAEGGGGGGDENNDDRLINGVMERNSEEEEAAELRRQAEVHPRLAHRRYDVPSQDVPQDGDEEVFAQIATSRGLLLNNSSLECNEEQHDVPTAVLPSSDLPCDCPPKESVDPIVDRKNDDNEESEAEEERTARHKQRTASAFTTTLPDGTAPHPPLPVFMSVDVEGGGSLEVGDVEEGQGKQTRPHPQPLPSVPELNNARCAPSFPAAPALSNKHGYENDRFVDLIDDGDNDSVGTAGSMSVFSPSFSAPYRRSFAGFTGESNTGKDEVELEKGSTAAMKHEVDLKDMEEEEGNSEEGDKKPFPTLNHDALANTTCVSSTTTRTTEQEQKTSTSGVSSTQRMTDSKRLKLPFSKNNPNPHSLTTTSNHNNNNNNNNTIVGSSTAWNNSAVVGGKNARVPGDTPPVTKSRRVVELFAASKEVRGDQEVKNSPDSQWFSKRPLPSPPTVPLPVPPHHAAEEINIHLAGKSDNESATDTPTMNVTGSRKISLAALLSGTKNTKKRPPPLSPPLDLSPHQVAGSSIGGGGMTSAGIPASGGPPLLGPSTSSGFATRSKTHEENQNPTVSGGGTGPSSGSVNTTSVSFSELGGNYSPTPAFSELVSTPTPQSQRHIHRATKIPIPLAPPVIQFSKLLQHRFVEDLYEIGSKISEGTYGEVYLGVERETNVPVALKRLKRLKGLDGFPLTSLREVTALRHIQAQRAKLLKAMQRDNSCSAATLEDPLPNIIRLRNVLLSSTSEHDIFLIFDYADYSMAGLLSGGKYPFDTDEVAYIFRQVVVALSRLHMMGIIHRDIKADNLLLSRQGNVFLADFGLCAFQGSGDGGGAGRNLTPSMIHLHYRPPEMLLGEMYDSKVDIWSVGCFLAQVYLGYPPFLHRPGALGTKPTAGQRSAETELEQLANVCDILGPLPIDDMMRGQGPGGGGGRRTARHLDALKELYRNYTSGNVGGNLRFSNARGPRGGERAYAPFPSALFEASPTYRKYKGFSGWFRQAVKERQQRYAREALSKPDAHIRLPLDPSDATVSVLCSIFTLSHRHRPSAMELLETPFFNYVDVIGVLLYSKDNMLEREKLILLEKQIQSKIAQKMLLQSDSHMTPVQQ